MIFRYCWRYRDGLVQRGTCKAENRADLHEKLCDWNAQAAFNDIPAVYWEDMTSLPS